MQSKDTTDIMALKEISHMFFDYRDKNAAENDTSDADYWYHSIGEPQIEQGNRKERRARKIKRKNNRCI